MKKILIAALILLCCPRMHPQNVEGQIIAAQYGEYKVPGQSTGGFQFPSDTCQVSGGNKNFSAFATGVAVKIVDANPALTEIATPSSVYIGACTINMATTYNHVPPYYLTSGTGGLQEAITANEQGIAGPNSIILNAEWYSLIQPRSAATVIGSVQGNTQLPLVDVTTTPYTWYQWGGSAYAAVSIGGGGVPCIGVAAWNSNTAYVASQLACSGGTLYTATAGSTNQQPSSVSAFWTPTYYAGAGIAGSVIVGGQYFSGGSTDGSGNPVPSFVSSSTHTLDFEQQLGTDIFQWGAQNDGSTQNYWSLLLHNTSGSTANAHNFTVNWASNSIGHDEWHQSNDNFLCWASGDSATGCSIGLSLGSDGATVDVGVSQGDYSKNIHANSMTAGGGVVVPSDGVHAGYDSLIGNTATPAVVPNTAGFFGPSLASFTAWGCQLPSASPSGGQVISCATPVNGVSAGSWVTPATGIGYPAGTGIPQVAGGTSWGTTLTTSGAGDVMLFPASVASQNLDATTNPSSTVPGSNACAPGLTYYPASGSTFGSAFCTDSGGAFHIYSFQPFTYAGGWVFGTFSSGNMTTPSQITNAFTLDKSGNGVFTGLVTGSSLLSKLYTVSSGTGNPALPSASSVAAGTQVTVTDATTFTPGTCTGGGSDYMIAISNGSTWSCH